MSLTAATTRTQHRARLTLAIDGTQHRVRPLARPDLPPGSVQGFSLTRHDPKLGPVRHTIALGLEGPRCSCQDRQFRPTPEGCKHIRAAQACGLI